MSNPQRGELMVYGTALIVMLLVVGTLEYRDYVDAEREHKIEVMRRPGIDRIPPPRCPEVYRGRHYAGWIVTQADKKNPLARCYYYRKLT